VLAKKEWARIVPELDRLGLLTIVDRLTLAGYCQAYARWRQAEEAIEKYGMIGKTESGYVQQLPYVSIAQKSLQLMKNLASEFGLTPSARSRLSVKPPEGDNEDDLD
jgi:P27 family predicted phage terminase small subunit